MQREDPPFKKELADVFASFNRLLSLPETQLAGIHKIQVSRSGDHWGCVVMVTPFTEGGVGVLPRHPAGAGSDILIWGDSVRRLWVWPLSTVYDVMLWCRHFTSGLLDSVRNMEISAIPLQKLTFITSVLESPIRLLDNEGCGPL